MQHIHSDEDSSCSSTNVSWVSNTSIIASLRVPLDYRNDKINQTNTEHGYAAIELKVIPHSCIVQEKFPISPHVLNRIHTMCIRIRNAIDSGLLTYILRWTRKIFKGWYQWFLNLVRPPCLFVSIVCLALRKEESIPWLKSWDQTDLTTTSGFQRLDYSAS